MTLKKILLIFKIAISFIALSLLSSTSIAKNPKSKFVANYRDWYVFTINSGKNKICYAQTIAQKAYPKNVNHGNNFLLISTFVASNIKLQPSVQFDYQIRNTPLPTIRIEQKQWKMFANNKHGFIDLSQEEKSLIRGMKQGKSMQVEAVSTRGTATSYRFSLLGVSSAIKRVSTECK